MSCHPFYSHSHSHSHPHKISKRFLIREFETNLPGVERTEQPFLLPLGPFHWTQDVNSTGEEDALDALRPLLYLLVRFPHPPQGQLCRAKRGAFLMKQEQNDWSESKRFEWNNVSLVVDVAIMAVAISRDLSRVCSSLSKHARFARFASHLL